MTDKSKKITNKAQYERLLDLMKSKPDIAAAELNSLGPPNKDTSNWKTVWSDYKCYIKKKLSANKKELISTGGGPNKERSLTPLEEEVTALLSLKDSVEGIGSKTFGIPSSSSKMSQLSKASSSSSCVPSTTGTNITKAPNSRKSPNQNVQSSQTNSEGVAEDILFEHLDDTDKENEGNTEEIGKKRKRQLTSIELLRKQINNQENYFKEVTNTFQSSTECFRDVANHLKRVYRALDKLGDDQKTQTQESRRHNRVLEEESRRHNAGMEELLKTKIELKRQLLEVEIMKLDANQN